VAPVTGRAQFTIAPLPEPFCAVYSGTSLPLLQLETKLGGGNSTYAFLAQAGVTYYFQLSGDSGYAQLVLTLYEFAVGEHDNFADALEIRGLTAGGTISVVGATMEPGEPQHLGAVPQKSVWWKWQPPSYGTGQIYTSGSLITNPVMAVYRGDSVDALLLHAKGTNTVTFGVAGGETYYIAGAVPTNTAIGDIALTIINSRDSSVHSVPANLLQQPSWEDTFLADGTYWHWTGPLGGYVNQSGGVDGRTWPSVHPGQKLWQSFPTTPGHYYRIRFAYGLDTGSTECAVRVSLDTNEVGMASITPPDGGYWHWATFVGLATNTNSTVTFEDLLGLTVMDAFSVVDQSVAPSIVTQPSSITTTEGGTATFMVDASGGPPLKYQWLFNGNILTNQFSPMLALYSITTNQLGNYHVIVSNDFGAVTSQVAALQIDFSLYPSIVWHPYAGTQPLGAYFSMSVAAIGLQPLTYQWFLDGNAISNATNQMLVFAGLQNTDAGTYTARVQNDYGSVFSLPAILIISTNNQGGGTINVHNYTVPSDPANAPIFNVDGLTRLQGGAYVVQLYAGASLAALRPAGPPTPFFSPFVVAGYFLPVTVTLSDVLPGAIAVAQLRVWESAKGNSYEEARARGGKYGKSAILNLTTSLPPTFPGGPPQPLAGLQSFSLKAGLPYFTSAVIQFVNQLPDGSMVWSLTGEPNYRYLIEQSAGDHVWQPYQVITNVTGTVNFTNVPPSGSNSVFFRSRILD
jgi:hypothetical protein